MPIYCQILSILGNYKAEYLISFQSGTPWSSHAWNSAYNMHAKSTMLMLLKYAQETLGCELIASADVSSKLAYEEERAYS